MTTIDQVIKRHKKQLNLERYKDEPVAYKIFGGLDGMVKRGMAEKVQKDLAAGFAQMTWDEQFKLGREYERPIAKKEGYQLGKTHGTSDGYISGVKDFMVDGKKYVVFPKSGAHKTYDTHVEAYKDPVIAKWRADKEVGAYNAETVYPASRSDKKFKQYDIFDNIDFIDYMAMEDNLPGSNVQNYNEKYKQVLKGNPQDWLSKNYPANKTPFHLTDEFHLYNTDTMRKMDPGDLTKKVMKKIDQRSNPQSHDNFKDYISRPSVKKTPLEQMDDEIIISNHKVAGYLENTFGPSSPISQDFKKKAPTYLKPIQIRPIPIDLGQKSPGKTWSDIVAPKDQFAGIQITDSLQIAEEIQTPTLSQTGRLSSDFSPAPTKSKSKSPKLSQMSRYDLDMAIQDNMDIINEVNIKEEVRLIEELGAEADWRNLVDDLYKQKQYRRSAREVQKTAQDELDALYVEQDAYLTKDQGLNARKFDILKQSKSEQVAPSELQKLEENFEQKEKKKQEKEVLKQQKLEEATKKKEETRKQKQEAALQKEQEHQEALEKERQASQSALNELQLLKEQQEEAALEKERKVAEKQQKKEEAAKKREETKKQKQEAALQKEQENQSALNELQQKVKDQEEKAAVKKQKLLANRKIANANREAWAVEKQREVDEALKEKETLKQQLEENAKKNLEEKTRRIISNGKKRQVLEEAKNQALEEANRLKEEKAAEEEAKKEALARGDRFRDEKSKRLAAKIEKTKGKIGALDKEETDLGLQKQTIMDDIKNAQDQLSKNKEERGAAETKYQEALKEIEEQKLAKTAVLNQSANDRKKILQEAHDEKEALKKQYNLYRKEAVNLKEIMDIAALEKKQKEAHQAEMAKSQKAQEKRHQEIRDKHKAEDEASLSDIETPPVTPKKKKPSSKTPRTIADPILPKSNTENRKKDVGKKSDKTG